MKKMKNSNEYIFRLWAAVTVLAIAVVFLFITSRRLDDVISTVYPLNRMNIGENIHAFEYSRFVK